MSVQLVKNYHLYDVIVRPLVTDKSYKAHEKNPLLYTFVVNNVADKLLIKKAIESIFGVTVKSVNVSVRKTRTRSYKGSRAEKKIKIANVVLRSGSISYNI